MIDGNAHPPINIAGDGPLRARFVTSMGTMVAELYEHRAPNTVANFVGLALGTKSYVDPRTGKPGSSPYYDGILFHRVIPNFMVQCGDPTATGTGGPGFRFKDEFHKELRHTGPGVLSMANAGPNTNGSQFFITEGPTPHLDNRHSVFGRVIEGVDLIGKIARVPTDGRDKPLTPVVLEKVEIFRA
ncbi:MAG: peptidylprolyl isomerase [Myxococcales bacterium]|nr:peptidylprolyl isomerase [Myxococcales bacterium]